jgi:arylsulfatase A-like enzyme
MRTRRASVAAVALIAVSVAPLSPAGGSEELQDAPPVTSPNVVLFLVDDATVADIEQMPSAQALVADQGVTFTRNYSPDPLCCPARATLLSGRYPHNHGVQDNVAPLGGFTAFDDSNTIATYLDDDYFTGLFGKYLNDNDRPLYVPPGWDSFKIPVSETTYRFVGQTMNVDGKLVDFPRQQSTNVYGRQTRAFMTRAQKRGEPFFALTSFVAPHRGTPHNDYPDDVDSPWVAPQDRYTVPRVLPADPTIGEADVSDKPARVRSQPVYTPEDYAYIIERNAQRVESLQAVDRQIEITVNHLAALGELNDTYIMVASDNGQMQGEHRITQGKGQAYDPSARVPLLIRGPGIMPNTTYDNVSGLQDFVPTVLGMTGQRFDQPTAGIDGVDLLGLISGRRSTSRPILIEIAQRSQLTDVQVERGAEVPDRVARRISSVAYRFRGLVTSDGYKYVEHQLTGEVELYNLNVDPYEETSLHAKPAYRSKLIDLRELLRLYEDCDRVACR